MLDVKFKMYFLSIHKVVADTFNFNEMTAIKRLKSYAWFFFLGETKIQWQTHAINMQWFHFPTIKIYIGKNPLKSSNKPKNPVY